MAAPEPEVVSPAAVPGKAWGPGSRDAWGTCLFPTAIPCHHVYPGPFSGRPSSVALIARRPSWPWLGQ